MQSHPSYQGIRNFKLPIVKRNPHMRIQFESKKKASEQAISEFEGNPHKI